MCTVHKMRYNRGMGKSRVFRRKWLKGMDNLHADFSFLYSWNKKRMFCLSPREDGKSSNVACKIIYREYKEYGRVGMVGVYNAVEINDDYVSQLETLINEFAVEKVHLTYSKANAHAGKAYVYDVTSEGNKPIMFFVSLNLRLKALKQLLVPNLSIFWIDEYIINPEKGERYPKGLALAVKELLKTQRRINPNLRELYTGNTYTLYHPIHYDLGVPLNKIRKPNTYYVGDDYVVWHKILNPKLREAIIARDIGHVFEKDYIFSDYERYAIEGATVNDEHFLIVEDLPNSYALKWLITYEGRKYGIYQLTDVLVKDAPRFWVGHADDYRGKKPSICFEFSEMASGVALFSAAQRNEFAYYKDRFRNGSVAFQDIQCGYMGEETFKYL